MINYIFPLVNWSNGIIMIGIFATFVILLIVIILSLMKGGNKT